MQKRKLKKIELTKNKKKGVKPKKQKLPKYHLYKNEQNHRDILEKITKGQTLILVPEVYLIDEVFGLLNKEQQKKTVIWNGSLSTKEKFERWLQIRNGEKTIILGTRAAVFLPFTNLKTIIIDFEEKENHKHWDQTPRFHAKDIASLLSKIHSSNLHLLSYSPSVESYFYVHKNNYKASNTFEQTKYESKNFSLVNMTDERRGKNFSIFSSDVEDAIIETKGDVFLFINRLGFATSVGCNDCGHKETCSGCKTPLVYHEKTRTLHCHYCKTKRAMQHACPTCRSTLVELRGMGTEHVDSLVRKLLGQKNTHKIIRIDSDNQFIDEKDDTPRLVIGTEMAFQHIRWKSTDLIVFLDIDKQLALPEFLAAEHVWHRIGEVNYRRNDSSTFYIQTFNPNQLVLKSTTEPDRFYRTDLNLRRSLGYPPYQYLTRYFFGHQNQMVAKKQAENLEKHLRERLTNEKKGIIISSHIEMHPRFYRRKFWYAILVKLPTKTWQDDLVWLNQYVPGSWKIDPNPISILSP